jgi:hypothetical protein
MPWWQPTKGLTKTIIEKTKEVGKHQFPTR